MFVSHKKDKSAEFLPPITGIVKIKKDAVNIPSVSLNEDLIISFQERQVVL